MTKVPFTLAGVNSKQAELYALNQTDLNKQADLVRTQFKAWVRDNFILTTDQDHYLEDMAGLFLDYLTSELSASLPIRLPIILIPPVDPHPSIDSSKRFRIRINVNAHVKGGVFQTDAAEMVLEITYDKD